LALVFAFLSTLCFALGLVTARVGLRGIDARAGAALSVPTATLLFVLLAPFVLDLQGFDMRAVLLFAAVGLVFPAAVTLLTFRSTALLGPTVTSTVASTAPLFALAAAALVLGEAVPAHAAVSALGVVAGVALLSWEGKGMRRSFRGRALLWPVAAAVVRGLAQVGAKAGLLLWANPFAASLVGYLMSSATLVTADRARSGRNVRLTRKDVAWFAGTGVINGLGVLSLYAALARAPVWQVAPIVASTPLVTAILSTAILRDERLSGRVVTGALVTVAAIVHLVGSQPGS